MWNECKDLQEYIVGLRRNLHQIPELGLHLPETAAYVTAELDKIGIPYICSRYFRRNFWKLCSKISQGSSIWPADSNCA